MRDYSIKVWTTNTQPWGVWGCASDPGFFGEDQIKQTTILQVARACF
jgi:hypothetical protein